MRSQRRGDLGGEVSRSRHRFSLNQPSCRSNLNKNYEVQTPIQAWSPNLQGSSSRASLDSCLGLWPPWTRRLQAQPWGGAGSAGTALGRHQDCSALGQVGDPEAGGFGSA